MPINTVSNRKRELLLIYGGGLCALIFCWLNIAVLAAFSDVLISRMGINRQLLDLKIDGLMSVIWPLAFICAMWLINLPLVAYAMGLISAFFWHRLQLSEEISAAPIGWAKVVFLFAVAPLFFVSGNASILAIAFLLPIVIFPMQHGIKIGSDGWKNRRWRHLLGFTNDYERDKS